MFRVKDSDVFPGTSPSFFHSHNLLKTNHLPSFPNNCKKPQKKRLLFFFCFISGNYLSHAMRKEFILPAVCFMYGIFQAASPRHRLPSFSAGNSERSKPDNFMRAPGYSYHARSRLRNQIAI